MQTLADNMKKINGNTLKVIACVTMVIDHITAGMILQAVRAGLYPDNIPFEKIVIIYDILRRIGRNSFPIFCFLLVEGFIHTKSRLRYALGLLIFGLISEPFFDVTFYAKQEVFNVKNNAQRLSFDDLLTWKRDFSSLIYKEANRYDREIADYIANSRDQRLESERITNELRTLESDLWEF